MQSKEQQSIALQSIARWYVISGYVIAALLIILMFVNRPCLEYLYADRCWERGEINYFYILYAIIAIGQAYIIETFLKSGARVIDLLRGIYDLLNSDRQPISENIKQEVRSASTEANNYKWDPATESIVITKKKLDDDFRLPPID